MTSTGGVEKPLLVAPAQRPPISVMIAEQIADAIMNGRFPIGTRLPSEQTLAADLAVSRVTVREALSCLRFAGYIESRRGSGTVVLPIPANASSTGSAENREGINIIEIIEARLVVEPVVIGLAAADPAPEGLRQVKAMLAGMELSLDSPRLHPHTDLRLHQAMVRCCRNRYLAGAAEHLLWRCDGPLWHNVQEKTWANRQTPDQWLRQHEQITTAIQERDSQKATEMARTHLVSVLDNLAASATLSDHQRTMLEAARQRAHSVAHGDGVHDRAPGDRPVPVTASPTANRDGHAGAVQPRGG